MKRFISTVLIFTLAISLATTASAAENSESAYAQPEYYSWSDVASAQSERLVYNRTWFALLRTSYANYESHYASNTALESDMGYIYGQATCPNFNIGNSTMSSVGCEIAAVYNAIKHRGGIVSCSNIIRIFERDGYLMTAGYLGSDPYAIGDYFDENMAYSLTEYTDFSAMETQVMDNISTLNVYIVSFWNSDSITDGLHTVCFYTQSGGSNIYIYNYYNSSTTVVAKSSFSSFVDSERFIVGYYVPRLGRMIEGI